MTKAGAVLLLTVMAACGRGETGEGSKADVGPGAAAVVVQYEVKLGGATEAGMASVRYRLPDGNDVAEDVSLPWTSSVLRFPSDERVVVSATLSGDPFRSLSCGVTTNQGPYGRASSRGGIGSCEFNRSLVEVGTR